MKQLAILFILIFFVACAEKQTVVKPSKQGMNQQPVVTTPSKQGKMITKWDHPEKGINEHEENIGISEEKTSEKNIPVSAAIREDIAKFASHDIHFDFDDYKIKAEDIPYLETLAQWLMQHKNYHLTIEGHCDERGSDLYNLALGEKRANSTKNFLVSLGVDAKRIDCISYGEEKPIDPGHNEQA